MKLRDGVEIRNVKIEIIFLIDNDGVEIGIEGDMESGWYSNVVGVSDLSRIMGEEDLCKIKMRLLGINGELRVG